MADIVILDRDILSAEKKKIKDIEVVTTIKGGRILYNKFKK